MGGVVSERAKLALKLLKLAADSGHPETNAVLGHIYETGGYEDKKSGKFHPILKKNIDKALVCYQTAADQGDELALNFMGAHAFNVTHNEVEAVQYFRKAAQSG